MKGLLGYGFYNDDPTHIGCPRAKSDMTPCVARDGDICLSDPPDPVCVGCGAKPADLLQELVKAVVDMVRAVTTEDDEVNERAEAEAFGGFQNRPMSDFFPGRETSLVMDARPCQACGVPVHYEEHSKHVRWHNEIGYKLWSLQAQIAGMMVWQRGPQPQTLVGDLDDGDAVADRHGRVWTIVRDGGMVTRPDSRNISNLETGGLEWLERAHGPLTVVFCKAEREGGTDVEEEDGRSADS